MLCITLIKNNLFRRGIIGIIMTDTYYIYDDFINVSYLCTCFDISLCAHIPMYALFSL